MFSPPQPPPCNPVPAVWGRLSVASCLRYVGCAAGRSAADLRLNRTGLVSMSTALPLQPRATGAASTALEDPRTRQLDPVLARMVLAGRISADAALRATVTAQEQRQSLAAAVTSLGLITSRDWAEAVARHYEFELVGGGELPREPLLADRISPRFLRHVAVLSVPGGDDTALPGLSGPRHRPPV